MYTPTLSLARALCCSLHCSRALSSSLCVCVSLSMPVCMCVWLSLSQLPTTPKNIRHNSTYTPPQTSRQLFEVVDQPSGFVRCAPHDVLAAAPMSMSENGAALVDWIATCGAFDS